MATVEVQNNKPSVKPLQNTGEVVLLREQGGGPGLLAVGQWEYSASVTGGRLPIQWSKPEDHKTPRSIKSSGCGLCAIVSYLHAAGCKVPDYDSTTRVFSTPAGAPLVDPGTFNLYLQNYINQKGGDDKSERNRLLHAIYGNDAEGALHSTNEDLKAAIDQLVQLSHPDVKLAVVPDQPQPPPASPATTAGPAGGLPAPAPTPPGAPAVQRPVVQAQFTLNKLTASGGIGVNLSEVNDAIDVSRPVIAGVVLEGGTGVGHQVLIVGYARFGKETYYIIIDSGWEYVDPYAKIDKWKSPARKQDVLPYTIGGPGRGQKYVSIGWTREMSGLEYFMFLGPWGPQ